MRRGTFRLQPLVVGRAIALALTMATAAAQAAQDAPDGWAVQTVALRDYREAQSVAEDLRARSLDAYTEFAMQDGLQFVRVRIGCYTDRAAAESMAAALRSSIVSEAVVVELSPGALVHACARSEVGFLKPSEWEPVNDPGAVPAFKVKVAGSDARVVHDGTRWRVIQGLGPIPLLSVSAEARFKPLMLGGVPFVAQQFGSTSYVVCPGKLLTSVGKVAIVEQGDLLVACDFQEELP